MKKYLLATLLLIGVMSKTYSIGENDEGKNQKEEKKANLFDSLETRSYDVLLDYLLEKKGELLDNIQPLLQTLSSVEVLGISNEAEAEANAIQEVLLNNLTDEIAKGLLNEDIKICEKTIEKSALLPKELQKALSPVLFEILIVLMGTQSDQNFSEKITDVLSKQHENQNAELAKVEILEKLEKKDDLDDLNYKAAMNGVDNVMEELTKKLLQITPINHHLPLFTAIESAITEHFLSKIIDPNEKLDLSFIKDNPKLKYRILDPILKKIYDRKNEIEKQALVKTLFDNKIDFFINKNSATIYDDEEVPCAVIQEYESDYTTKHGSVISLSEEFLCSLLIVAKDDIDDNTTSISDSMYYTGRVRSGVELDELAEVRFVGHSDKPIILFWSDAARHAHSCYHKTPDLDNEGFRSIYKELCDRYESHRGKVYDDYDND